VSEHEGLRVVIAEDHYLVREGTRQVLDEADGIAVVAAVGSGMELEQVVDRERPDVVVTDIRMPPDHGTEGIEAARRIRARHPGIGVVVLSQYADASYAMDLLRDGTAGRAYLLKERVGDPAQLVAAVRTVATGGSWIDPDVVAAMVEHGTRQATSPLRELTPRELEVLEQMARGRTNAAIASALGLSESSIEKYSTSVFLKLGLSDEPETHRRVAAVLTLLHDQGRARPIADGGTTGAAR
jgi:DNA-binding NarL/FixJ family response regulator